MRRDEYIVQLVLPGPSPAVGSAWLPCSHLPGRPGRHLEVKVPQGAGKSKARLEVGHGLAGAGPVADEEGHKGLAHAGQGGIVFLGYVPLAARGSTEPALGLEGKGVGEVLLVVQERVEADGDLGAARYDVPVDDKGLSTAVLYVLLAPQRGEGGRGHAEGLVDACAEVLAAAEPGAGPYLARGAELGTYLRCESFVA